MHMFKFTRRAPGVDTKHHRFPLRSCWPSLFTCNVQQSLLSFTKDKVPSLVLLKSSTQTFKKNGILNFFNTWRLIKKLWGFYNHTTDLCHRDTTSVQTLQFLWETGSVLICNRDYNEDKFNCWWQITEPVEDCSAAALPREQLEKQSSILFLLKRFLSLIRKKKKITIMLPQNRFVIRSQI